MNNNDTKKIKKTHFVLFRKFWGQPWSVKILLSVLFLYFVIQAVVHLMPMLWVINNSLKTTEEFFESSITLTKSWAISNYVEVFQLFKVKGGVGYFEMLFNSMWITIVYVFANVLSSILVAYAIARFKFPGRGFLYGVAIFAKMIPILGTEAAAFKLKVALGMVNNPITIWMAWAVGFDYTFIVLYGTFKGIGFDYSEAATIDGANNFVVLLRIIIPIAMPAIIAMAINQIMGLWNNYSLSQIVLSKYPNLAYGLYLFQLESTWVANTKGVYFASVVLTAMPVILLYVFGQELIIKNIAIGGIKG